jgi:hypothetical protein
MRPFLPAPILAQERVPLEDRIHRTAGRPRATRVPHPQHAEQLLRAPPVLQSGGDDQLLQRFARAMRARLRCSAAIDQARTAARLMACEPLVTGRAGDAVALAQLGHRPVATLQVVHEREAFLHHIRFHPGHPPDVNDVPRLVLTMSPACTFRPPNARS